MQRWNDVNFDTRDALRSRSPPPLLQALLLSSTQGDIGWRPIASEPRAAIQL